MSTQRIYLDHNATAPLRPEAASAMAVAMGVCGNPSSVHHEGRRVRALIETAREQVAKLVNAKPLEVVFTSGATEANAWVIGGGEWATILSAEIEHDSGKPDQPDCDEVTGVDSEPDQWRNFAEFPDGDGSSKRHQWRRR